MRLFRKIIFAALMLAAFAPQLFACPACGSANSDMPASPLTNGMNLGILTLMGVVLSVLTCAAVFFVNIVRKEEAALKNSEPKNPADV